MQWGSLGVSRRRSPQRWWWAGKGICSGSSSSAAHPLPCQQPPNCPPQEREEAPEEPAAGKAPSICCRRSPVAEEKGFGHGRIPPGHSLPAPAGWGDAVKATGWDNKRGEEGSKCQATSHFGDSQSEDGAVGEWKRRQIMEPGW